MPKTIVTPDNAPPPLAPYSSGVIAGNTLYVSGTLPIAGDGSTVGVGDVRAQTRHVLELIRSVVAAAGGTMEDIVFNTIILKDLGDYAAMNEVYREYFPANPPARYCFKADLVKPEYLVEIVPIAHI